MNAVPTMAISAIALFMAMPASGQDETPRGVNPRENVNKLELIYRGDRLDGSRHLDAFAAKYDRALTPQLGANVEVPLVRFAAPGLSELGLGDLLFRLRYNLQVGAVTVIPGLEVVAPTAADDVLGLGKWQFNPVVGAVFAPTPTSFVFAGYKHLRSFAGDAARLDVNASQPRVLVGMLSAQGWWMLGDLKYTYDHGTRIETLDAEIEAGQMLSANLGISVRLGTSALDAARNASLGLNLRFLF